MASRGCFLIVVLVFNLLVGLFPIAAQGDSNPNLVGRLRTTTPRLEMRRVNTAGWVAIRRESLFGVGDSARTNPAGTGQISLLDGLLTLDLQGSSQATLNAFRGTVNAFTAEIRAEAGLFVATSRRTLPETNAPSAYRIVTPAFTAALLSGTARFRIQADGRSSVVVGVGGRVEVAGPGGAMAVLSAGQGLRAEVGGSLSEVVPAENFPTLDVALDGCPSDLQLTGDVRQNVRLGAGPNYDIVGGLPDGTALRVMGITGSGGWYRILFAGGYGWLNVARLPLPAACIGLRIFPDNFGPEDRTRYRPDGGN